MTWNEDLSRDLLQEAFIKIWRNASSYDPGKGALYTWMVNITRNLCIDHLRSKRHKNSLKDRDIDDHSYELESDNKFHPEFLGLKSLLHKLPPEQRQVIYYSYFKGFTQKEISEKFKIPLGTIKSRAKAALKKLRKNF